MKRSTARWTTAFAAAAWLALPAAAWSQTPPTTTPPSSPKPAQQPAASSHQQHGSAQEHIRQAQAALNDIPAASIPARSKAQITELKRHLGALEKSSGANTAGTKTTARSKSNWATEVAAIDKILTELLGSATTSATAEPTGATGTAGTTGTTKSRSATTLTLDETAKTKLMEVRTAVTQYAAAMSGTGAPAPGSTPSEPAVNSAASTTPSSTSTSTTTTAATPAEQPKQAAAAPQVDAEASKRHLTAARDTLSQLTQLPAAAQLTGDARTQISQLIANFNELITTTGDWKAPFDKVNGNVTALLNAETTTPAQTPAPTTGTPGAVGTSGTAAAGSLDPGVRAKLVEFRNHLIEFEKAAGAKSAATTASAPSATSPTTSATTPSSPATSSPSPASPATSSPSPASPATSSPNPSSMATSSPATSTPAEQSASTTAQRPAAMGQDNAVRHIEAIEAILNGRAASSSPAGSTATPTAGTPTGSTPTGSTPTGGTPTGNPPSATAGTTGTGAASVTLDRAQLEQIRMHLAELRKVVEKK